MSGALGRLNTNPADSIPAMHCPTTPHDPDPLLAFNQQMLDQALALVAFHAAPGAPGYAGPVGSHLRHVIEHWDALVFPARPGCVAYDARPRDPALDTSPSLAERRLMALRQQLAGWTPDALAAQVLVHGVCGSAGEFHFSVTSTVGRELAFVATHAVHHFALLKEHCLRSGIAIDADFGKAPATVASERSQSAAVRAESIVQAL